MILNPESSLNPELKPAGEPRNAGPAALPEGRPAAPADAPPRMPRRVRAQPEILHLPLSRRTVLVTADVVRAVYGVEAEAVTAKVESGELQWVFDVSVRGNHVRVPRFWARELMASRAVPDDAGAGGADDSGAGPPELAQHGDSAVADDLAGNDDALAPVAGVAREDEGAHGLGDARAAGEVFAQAIVVEEVTIKF